MSSAQDPLSNGGNGKRPPGEAIPDLSRNEVLRLAVNHLASIGGGGTPPPAPPTRVPRLRRIGRRLWSAGVRLLEWAEVVGRFLINPRHPPGSWLARLRLLMPWQTLNPWKLLLVLFAALLGLAEFYSFRQSFPFYLHDKAPWQKGALVAVIGSLFTGTVVVVLAAFWNDLIRCPYLGRRVRRQIRKRPDCVLLRDISRRAVRLVRYEAPLEIVARTNLYDELTPGILARWRKDVQIVVGDPGSGKTTALIGIAGMLARLGIVPVLVPLGALAKADLVEQAETRFKRQVGNVVRSDAEADLLWRWLCRRRRVAILCDNLDRVGAGGERGFQMRQALKDARSAGLPVIVTARPAGVPAGIAASAVELGQLDEQTAVDCIVRGARNDPGFRRSDETPRPWLEHWVRQGELAAVPFYLEILAQLAAGGKLPKLSEPGSGGIESRPDGRYRWRGDGTIEWNAWWVRFLLLERYYESVAAGRVRRWLGIETRERTHTLQALQDAALGLLGATACEARAAARPRGERDRLMPERTRLEDFVGTNDRRTAVGGECRNARPAERPEVVAQRSGISAQEALETGERLRILEHDDDGEPEFRHRIMQGYLAGRRLARMAYEKGEHERKEWTELLLERRHPEKLTAQVALTFAALCADAERHVAKQSADAADGDEALSRAEKWETVSVGIVRDLVESARQSNQDADARTASDTALAPATAGVAVAAATVSVATDGEDASSLLAVATLAAPREDRSNCGADDLDPMHARDPEERRDPDDALIKLTTAADVAAAIGCKAEPDAGATSREKDVTQHEIAEQMSGTGLVARWTKINAIAALAELSTHERWSRIWDFAHDPDYQVRQAASAALDDCAFDAYRALHDDIEVLIVRAAGRSALGLGLQQPELDLGLGLQQPEVDPNRIESEYMLTPWRREDYERLAALGAVLPAIVSGLREDPTTHTLEAWQGRDRDECGPERRNRRPIGHDQHRFDSKDAYMVYVRRARASLEQLVALAFQGGYPDLEAAVAKGFRLDAMRHAEERRRGAPPAADSHAGPGWVAGHAGLVANVCLPRAGFWFAQLALTQALALYAIAGGDRDQALDVFARYLHRGGEIRHPFAQRAGRLARAAVQRSSLRGGRWHGFVWEDEVQGSGRASVALTTGTAQLLADVTVLLDLNEGAQEDRKQPFGSMTVLPHCLHGSRDRTEILATGCPPECGWNLCPYKQPPADEPNEHRGVSRTFCRQQRRLAWHRRPRWQRRISRRRLAEFWQEMEFRARR